MIHFWAAWNTIDKQNDGSPGAGSTGTTEPDRIRQADVDQLPTHSDILKQHKILNLPFLAFYRDGLLVEIVIGMIGPGF